MATNVFTKIPKRGDLEVRRISDRKPFYITAGSLSATEINTSVYEIIGPVLECKNGKVLVALKENASNTWCSRPWWYLSGYTLDGTQRSGVLSFRFARNSYGANIDKTISYSATTAEGLVGQLNSFFAQDADLSEQDAYANIEPDGRVRICVDYKSYQQLSGNTAKSGFTLTGALPEIASLANMRRKHGGGGGEGAISSWDRALAYFRADNSTANYNPSTDVTSIKATYPICLPGYLGTSQYQSDHCAYLRSVYGEGEEGWIRFMCSCVPVHDCGHGNMAQDFGREITEKLASFTYTSSKQTSPKAMCAAASYCYNKSGQTYDAGEFWLPAPKQLQTLLDGIHYGTTLGRTADIVNATLYKIDGNSISNGSYFWSCSRYYSGVAWFAGGYYGFFSNYSMGVSYVCVPVSLHAA